ncbi:MAG: hypothetical protein HOP12_11220 [Candidatus Eisenbacteria bacterium]|uniref:Outer membrane protein beta-barrel domain-containing protein n=1 Tax=Eiseniibacteriota bacterium TaxID=2212470 RepID=A0A849SRQ4_UNCEI|nr:hypothetical protein [Candidatus Eisenbacteria bacterium]
MKKLVTILSLAALTTLAGSAAWAKDMKGMWGLGYTRSEFPIGARFWLSPSVGLDLGVGFSAFTPDGGDGQTAFGVDVGVPFVVASTENAHFFVRPGISFADNGAEVGPFTDAVSQFWVSGTLGAEYFFTDSFSIQAGHGILYRSVTTEFEVSPGVTDEVTDSYIESEAFGISSIGFHWYWGGSR